MTEEQFISALSDALKGLAPGERDDILQDFREHFQAGRAEGRTDAEIAASLGSPQTIARELLATHHLQQAEAKITPGNVLRAAWAVAGLSLFNLVFVLGPVLGLLGIWFAGWVTGFSLLLSPLLVLAHIFLSPADSLSLGVLLFDFFLAVALAGLGVLAVVGMWYVTRGLARMLLGYLRFNAQLVMGGLKYESR